MDLVYIPEVLTFGSFRSPQYRDYEQPWNKDYFRCNKKPTQVNQWQQPPQQPKEVSKKNCYFCQETKRRSLAAYIRSKSRSGTCDEIHEEDEEEEEKKEVDAISGEKKTADIGKNQSATYNAEDKQKS